MKSILVVIACFILISIAQVRSSITNDEICVPETDANRCNTEVLPLEECDQEICGYDKMCKQYHSIADNLVYHPYLEYRNVTHISSSIALNEQEINYNRRRGVHRNNPYIRFESDCLPRSQLSNLNLRLINESSFSPWEYVINRDENRIPRDILETRCRCNLCLNPSRSNYNARYLSRALTVTRYFNLKDRGDEVFHAEFSYGCICEYAENGRIKSGK